tara:strand:- start:565 stop:861 length:297 start_codon:yes stop_codon:yes gene_type:complete
VTGIIEYDENAMAMLWKLNGKDGSIIWEMSYRAPEFTMPNEPIYKHYSDDGATEGWRGGTAFESVKITSNGDAIIGGAVGLLHMNFKNGHFKSGGNIQ